MTTIAMETSTMTGNVKKNAQISKFNRFPEKVCPGDTTCPDLLAYGGNPDILI